MFLKKIEVFGFKSFADKLEINFDGGITGIVGPNGSGKSNVADAVRWVLGEQNVRSLRGSKMEDVIFGGTEQRKALSYCEVALFFDNEDGALNLDYSEVVVSRRLYRSGESEYLLNGNQCRLKDVVRLFQDTGIGKEGYSIIGQGRIDAILSNKSEERRSVFEEAAGIVKFRTSKEEAQRRLNHTENNLIRIEDILSELQLQVEPLAQQSETAKKYLSLRETLKDGEVNLFIHQYEHIAQRREEIEQTVQGLDEANAQKEKESVQVAEDYMALEQSLNALAEQQSELTGRRIDLSSHIEKNLGQAGIVEERINYLNKEIDRLRSEIEQEKILMACRTEQSAANGDKQEAFAAEIDALQSEIGTLQAELTRAEQEAEAKEQAFDELKNTMIAQMNKLSDVRVNLSRLQAGKSSIDTRNGQLETLISGAYEEMQLRRSALDEANGELSALLAALEQAEGERDGVLAEQKAVTDGIAALKQDYHEAKSNINGTLARLNMLKEMKNDYEGFYSSVKNLLAAADRDERLGKGICGVVAQLIRVPEEYETAIEIALGAAIQHIVTETDRDAKTAIEYLKNNRLGRATFLPVSVMKSRLLNQAERSYLSRTRGVASDLIGYEPKYKQVMENLLGRTVIVEDLDTAIQVARQSGHAFKLVTLAGEVVNPGGSMSGGSRQSANTSLLSRDREIEKISKEYEKQKMLIDNASAMLAEKEAALEAMQGDVERVQLQVQECLGRYGQCQQKVAMMTAMVQSYEEKHGELVEERQRLAETMADIDRQIGEIENQQDTASERSTIAQEDITAAQSEIIQARARRDALLEQVNDRRNRLNGITLEQRTLQNQMTRDSAEQELSVKQIAQKEAAIAEGLAQIENNHFIISQGSEQAGMYRQQLEQLKAEEQALNAEQDRLKQQRSELEQRRESLYKATGELVEKKHKLQMGLQKIESDLEAMQTRIWDEYELTYGTAVELRRADFKPEGMPTRIEKLKKEIAALGYVNVNALQDYVAVKARLEELTVQHDDLIKAKGDLISIIEDMTVNMRKQFAEQFAHINSNFGRIFKELFGGGTAELRLDSEDILECGIEIVAQPPGKSLQHLSLLSGGEKALTAIAILFAMLTLKPVPFCILDEIEAALDESNVYRFASYLRNFSKTTQFVVITHRKPTMQEADALYGVAMEEKGVSRIVSIKLSEQGE